jgi:hypothetical protein
MLILILTLTSCLALLWGFTILERIDALIYNTRKPSAWSLYLVVIIFLIHIILLYMEGVLPCISCINYQ